MDNTVPNQSDPQAIPATTPPQTVSTDPPNPSPMSDTSPPASDMPVFLDPAVAPPSEPVQATPASDIDVQAGETKRPSFLTVEESTTAQTSEQPKPADQEPALPPAAPSFVVTPTPPSKGGGKKIAAIMGVIGLVAATVIGVVAVGGSRLRQSSAWDCEKYNFLVTKDGTVTVTNGSTRNEPIQKADVTINGSLVQTFDVPALSPGQNATLGTVTVPSGTFTWQVKGSSDCQDGGSYQGTVTPSPSPSASPSPSPSGSPSPSPSTSASPSASPSTPPGTAYCGAVKAYDKDWKELSASALSNLKAGAVVRLTVGGVTDSGNFDKARFTVNGTQRSEVTTKRPGTNDFYDEYTLPSPLPSGTFTVNVKAEVHHQQQNKWL